LTLVPERSMIPGMDKKTGIDKLLAIMEELRSDKGCPWDKEQTMNSLKPFVIEEAYEVVEAIDSGNHGKVCEELGDLLLQIVFLSQIGQEAGSFSFYDVVQGINEKLLRRHPHVFGDEEAKNSEEVLHRWEQIKRNEKTNRKRKSILEGTPEALPALLRAHRLQDRASRVGFDWKETSQVLKKVEEEFDEFKTSLKENDQAQMEREFGDILFALVNLSRFIQANPEDALRAAIRRFVSRFQYIEDHAMQKGVELHTLSLEEMDRLWDEAKKLERI
jgi:tetrapyrrole methylase family protein/MazG family protein